MGTLPFVVKAGVESLISKKFEIIDFNFTSLTFIAILPIMFYLVSGTSSVPKGFQSLSTVFLIIYILFMATEVVPFVFANTNIKFSPFGFSKSTYYTAVLVLILIPFYRLGESNDFVMRASIPSLAIIAVTTGHGIFRLAQDGRTKHMLASMGVLIIGAITGLDQLSHVVNSRNLGIRKCSIVQAWEESPYTSTPYSEYFVDLRKVRSLMIAKNPTIVDVKANPAKCSDQSLKY